MWSRRFAVTLLFVAFGSARRPVHLYTFSDTIPHPGICVLAEALAESGGQLRVIGLSKRPGYLLIQNHSPTLKFLMLQEVVEYEVEIGRISSDDLMIFVDGHDVLLMRPIDELVAAYEKFPDSPYLISGEKNCWPWPHTDESHGRWDPGMDVSANKTWDIHEWLQITATDFCRVVPAKGPYRYPNIGTSMGPVSRFLEVLRRNNRVVLDEDANDQGAMWVVILRHAVELNIVIDQNATVFLNMLQYDPGDLEREPCGDDWFSAIDEREQVFRVGDAVHAFYSGDKDYPGWYTATIEADSADGTYKVSWNDPGDFGDTIKRLDQIRAASPGTTRRPPSLRLTNTTPALLHFNGPSHEDEVWPTCYHASNREFRREGVGHSFFDVDHGIVIGTDQICDYSWYKIKSFHAHPMNAVTLGFLEELHQLKVDPGLLAWRGSSSTVDDVRLGRESDLHAGTLIGKALSAGS